MDKWKVLEGSVLKPVLFSILTSDLCTITGRLRMKMTPTWEFTKGKNGILWVIQKTGEQEH